MALVAYDNSDSSDYEDEEPGDAKATVTLKAQVEESNHMASTLSAADRVQEEPLSGSSDSLFTQLPRPTGKKPMVVEEDDEFLHKKENAANIVKPKAKITVPSLDDFKDVDGTIPSAKPKAANGKKSGLLSILPQPKNATLLTKATTKSLIPHVLTKKPDATVKKKVPLPSPLKKTKTDAKLLPEYSDDSDNDDEVVNDFFSMNKPVELPPVEDIPLDMDKKNIEPEIVPTPSNQKLPPKIQSYFKQDVENHVELQPDYSEGSTGIEYGRDEASSSAHSNHEAPHSTNNGEIQLDDEAILKLCGARGKRKREDIQIVDVNQQEVLADAREWLLKGLMDDTTKRVSASKKKGNEPTNQQKRKHQITYLAHQAKANEAELQNQWANSRMSRRQTQSKYGF